MNLTALKGNERVKEQLSQQERRRGLSHAYILSGPGGSGRHTLARLLAAEGGEALGDGDVHGRAFLCGGLRDEVMRFHWFQRAKKAGCVPPLLG